MRSRQRLPRAAGRERRGDVCSVGGCRTSSFKVHREDRVSVLAQNATLGAAASTRVTMSAGDGRRATPSAACASKPPRHRERDRRLAVEYPGILFDFARSGGGLVVFGEEAVPGETVG